MTENEENILSRLHDSSLVGITCSKRILSLSFVDADALETEIVVDNVLTLCANHFYAGNIVFKLAIVEPLLCEASVITEYFDSDIVPKPGEFLKKIESRNGKILLIDCSYGVKLASAFVGRLIINQGV